MMIALFSLALFAAALFAVMAVMAVTLLPAMPRIIALLRDGSVPVSDARFAPYAGAPRRPGRPVSFAVAARPQGTPAMTLRAAA